MSAPASIAKTALRGLKRRNTDMDCLPLNQRDEELIEAAREVIQRSFDRGRHQVGAALLSASGRIYSAINVGSRRISICAEEIALGMALSNGDRTFDAIVAVTMLNKGDKPQVVSPCGICREVVSYYGPDISVIFVDEG